MMSKRELELTIKKLTQEIREKDEEIQRLITEKNKSKADNRRLEDIADVALCVFIVLEEMGVNCSQVIHEARERNKYLTIEDKNDLWKEFKNGI